VPFTALPDIEMLTVSAAVVSPLRENMNVPVSPPASFAAASVAETDTSTEHAFVPAGTRATLDEDGPIVTFAVSTLPASSVTVRQTEELPVFGAVTLAVGPVLMTVPPFIHEYDAIVCVFAAVLPLPCSVSVAPGLTAPCTIRFAMGRSAACTELFAFAIPAPQAAVVQMHSVF
jgi:hypothetical protein